MSAKKKPAHADRVHDQPFLTTVPPPKVRKKDILVSRELKGPIQLYLSPWLLAEAMQAYYLRGGKLVRLKRPRRQRKAA